MLVLSRVSRGLDKCLSLASSKVHSKPLQVYRFPFTVARAVITRPLLETRHILTLASALALTLVKPKDI